MSSLVVARDAAGISNAGGLPELQLSSVALTFLRCR